MPSEANTTLRRPAAAVGAMVLVVDDAGFVRNWAREALEARGHRVLTATGAEEALAVAETETIDVLVTDVVMPGTDGVDLADAFTRISPGTRVILMSAYSERIVVRGESPHAYLQKPFSGADLAAAVEAAAARD